MLGSGRVMTAIPVKDVERARVARAGIEPATPRSSREQPAWAMTEPSGAGVSDLARTLSHLAHRRRCH